MVIKQRLKVLKILKIHVYILNLICYNNRINKNKGYFKLATVLEFTTTSACNYGCTYCFEGHISEEENKTRIKESKTKITHEDAIRLVEEYRKHVEDGEINMCFWGGEPMLNFPWAKECIKRFKDDDRITFMFYTNGSYVKQFKDDIKELHDMVCTNGRNGRLHIQISYDGVSNDINRLDKAKRTTSAKVIEAYKILKEMGVSVNLKSTLPTESFKYAFENMKAVLALGEHSYAPSPDVHNEVPEELAKKYANDLKVNLIKIAKYLFDNKLPLDTFKWFSQSKAMCHTGYRYLTVDVDGSIFPCHGVMYPKEEYNIVNIRDPEVGQKLKIEADKWKPYALSEWTNPICSKCDALFCIRCPAAFASLPSAEREHKDKYERFTHHNDFSCSVFKMNDKIHKAVLKAYLDAGIPIEQIYTSRPYSCNY